MCESPDTLRLVSLPPDFCLLPAAPRALTHERDVCCALSKTRERDGPRRMSTPVDVKRKASFEPGSAPPKKMALLASSHPEPSTPDASAPDPKKAVSAAHSHALTDREPATPPLGSSQAPSAHSSMNATVLQRQNLALQNSLEQKRRDLEELQQKLERTEKRLITQDSAISLLDRHWEQTEQQAAALLARVQDDQAAAAGGTPGGLLGQLSAPKPLTPGELDSQLYPHPSFSPDSDPAHPTPRHTSNPHTHTPCPHPRSPSPYSAALDVTPIFVPSPANRTFNPEPNATHSPRRARISGELDEQLARRAGRFQQLVGRASEAVQATPTP